MGKSESHRRRWPIFSKPVVTITTSENYAAFYRLIINSTAPSFLKGFLKGTRITRPQGGLALWIELTRPNVQFTGSISKLYATMFRFAMVRGAER